MSTAPSGINFGQAEIAVDVSAAASVSFFVNAAVDHLLCLDEFNTIFVGTFIFLADFIHLIIRVASRSMQH